MDTQLELPHVPELPRLQGSITTPDGWKLEWDTPCVYCSKLNDPGTHRTCHHKGLIVAYNAKGDRRWHISGIIGHGKLSKEISAFRAEHSGQLRMEL